VYVYVGVGSLHMCVYEYVIGCTCEFMGECVSQLQHADSFARFESDNRRLGLDSNLCPLWTRWTGNSKIDP